MDKLQFKDFRAACRKARQSREVIHNGRRYSVSRQGVDRLDSAGCYERVPGAQHAMTLLHAGDMRSRAEGWAKRSARVMINMARAYRLESRA